MQGTYRVTQLVSRSLTGFNLKDIDECATGSHTCDEGFVCQNLEQKYDCVRPDVPNVCHEPIAPMPGSFQTGRKFNGENSQVIDLKIAANDYYEFAVSFRTRDTSGVLMEFSSRKSKKNKGQFIRVKMIDGVVSTVLSEGSAVKGKACRKLFLDFNDFCFRGAKRDEQLLDRIFFKIDVSPRVRNKRRTRDLDRRRFHLRTRRIRTEHVWHQYAPGRSLLSSADYVFGRSSNWAEAKTAR